MVWFSHGLALIWMPSIWAFWRMVRIWDWAFRKFIFTEVFAAGKKAFHKQYYLCDYQRYNAKIIIFSIKKHIFVEHTL